MTLIQTVLEILKFTIPALVIGITFLILVKSFFKKEYNMRLYDLRLKTNKETIPTRLQAYERIALFLERIDFNNLIIRIRHPQMSAKQLQIAMTAAIRQEFEHNMAQQIYLTPELWRVVLISKDENLKVLNLISATLPEEATGNDLSKAIFEYFMKQEMDSPSGKALSMLKREVQEIFWKYN